MRKDNVTVAPSTAQPALPRVEVDPSAHMVEDLFAQFLVEDEYFSAEASATAPADLPFPSGLEETPEETPLDTPDDHFGSAALDAEITSPMPCFGADIFSKSDSTDATAPFDESFSMAFDQFEQLFAAAQSYTAPPVEHTNTPSTSASASLPPLDQAPYVIDQTPAIGPAPLPPTTPLALSVPLTPATPTMAFDESSVHPHSSRPMKPLPTGVRRNITVDKLVPLDAPTQPRHYVGESATSRKAVPAAFRKKRNITEVEDPNDLEAIEEKRRKNTLAARKSRARKLETLQSLQETCNALTAEKDYWQSRAMVAEDLLRVNGLSSPSS